MKDLSNPSPESGARARATGQQPARGSASENLHSVVVGAGVAGLAAAVALRKHGIETTLVDPSVGGVPGGMPAEHRVLIWNNGVQALKALCGVDLASAQSDLKQHCIGRFEHREPGGETQWGMDMAGLPGSPQAAILVELRGLRKLLREHHPNKARVKFKLPQEAKGSFEHFTDDGRRIRVQWQPSEKSKRETIHADLLLGAAGKRDPVRKQLFGRNAVHHFGYSTFAGHFGDEGSELAQSVQDLLVPPNKSGQLTLLGYLGRDAWFDVVQLSEKRCFWMAAVSNEKAELTDAFLRRLAQPLTPKDKARLAAALCKGLAEMPAPLRLAVVTSEFGRPVPLIDVRVPRRATRGGVAIIGDALHGVTLVLGQSVGLALEDAATLDKCLAEAKLDKARSKAERQVRARKALAKWGRLRTARPVIFNLASHLMPRVALHRGTPDRPAQPPRSRHHPPGRPALRGRTAPVRSGPVPLSGPPPPSFGDRFEVRAELGRGSAGIVYEAFDRTLNHKTALKALPLLSDTEHRRLRQEFRLLRQVHHRNVVDLYELHTEGPRAWFTMELVDGPDLVEALRSADAGEQTRIILETIAGIEAVHATALVHRDIKPSNILVGGDGRVRVLDFGLAETSASLCAIDEYVGTPLYSSPEALWGKADAASDWYSFGVVLLEAFSPPGSLARTGPPALGVRALASLLPETPPAIARAIEELLHPEPGRRPDAAQLATLLGGEPQARPPRAPFVGREAEFARLAHAGSHLPPDGPAVVELLGPAGVGKTRLLEEFVGGLRADRHALLRARCHHTEQIPHRVLDPLLDDLDAMLERRPSDDGALSQAVAAWRSSIAETSAAMGVAPALAPAEMRRQVLRRVRSVLRALAAERSLVVALEDVHWGDVESATLLLDLLGGTPCLVLVTSREESAPLPFLVALRKDERVRTYESVVVAPLPPAESRELAYRMAPNATPAELEALLRRAGGLPFALEGSRRAQGAPLDERARSLLALLALDPEPTPRSLAMEVGGSPADGFPALRSLEEAGLVRLLPGEQRVALYHELVRGPVLDEMEPEARANLHREAAASLERLEPHDHRRRVHHLVGCGETSRAADVSLMAADLAKTKLQFAQEAAWLGRCLELRGNATGAADLHSRQAGALQDAGRVSEAADAWLQAARALDEADPRWGMTRAKAAGALISTGRIDEGEMVLEPLLREAGVNYPKSAAAGLVVGMGQRMVGAALGYRDPVLGRESTAAMDLLRVANALTLSRMHTAFGLSGTFFRRAWRSGTVLDQVDAIAAEAPFQTGLGGAWARNAARLTDRLEHLHHNHDLPTDRNAEQTRGPVAWHRGHWREAAEQSERAGALLRSMPRVESLRLTIVDLFACSARCHLGEFAELGDRVELALESALDRGERIARVVLDAGDPGIRYFARGDVDGAERLARRVWDLVPDDAGVFEYAAATHVARTDVCRGRYAEGLERLRTAMPRLKKNQALAMQSVRTIVTDLEGRLLLGLGRQLGLPAVERDLRRVLRTLRRCEVGFAEPIRRRIEAGRARLRGNEDEAIKEYLAAAAAFEEAEMPVHSWVARVAAGQPVADPDGVAAETMRAMIDPLAAE